MISFDDYTNGNKTEDYPRWPYVPDCPYIILVTEFLDQEKEMYYYNQSDIDKIYSYAKYSYEVKCQSIFS